MTALRSHGEALQLEASVKRWGHEQRRLVFPNEVGRVTRYGTFAGKVWAKLIEAAKLPYPKPHAMRPPWMLEEGADLRYVKDQMGHASIEETEGTYGHLQRERHEQRVDLDQVLGRPAASTGVHEGRRHDAEQAEVLIYRARFSWWRVRDSNPRPRRCERRALPTELTPRTTKPPYSTWPPCLSQPRRASDYSRQDFGPPPTRSSNGPMRSIGSGKNVVVFRSEAISRIVCR